MSATVVWVTGLVMMAGAIAYILAGPLTAIVAVGAVLFFVGVAEDYWGGV